MPFQLLNKKQYVVCVLSSIDCLCMIRRATLKSRCHGFDGKESISFHRHEFKLVVIFHQLIFGRLTQDELRGIGPEKGLRL